MEHARTRIPGRLAAPSPGWTARADVIVVGSGVAGLTTALRVRARAECPVGDEGDGERRLYSAGPGWDRGRSADDDHPPSTCETPQAGEGW